MEPDGEIKGNNSSYKFRIKFGNLQMVYSLYYLTISFITYLFWYVAISYNHNDYFSKIKQWVYEERNIALQRNQHNYVVWKTD